MQISMRDVSDELIRRFDVPGPRYTSYPTADRFVEAFGPVEYEQALRERRDRAAPAPLSVYVHLPFCESLCYYGACNKIVTRHHDHAATYLQFLKREIEGVTASLGRVQKVSQLHLGGGTPTFLTDAELAELMAMLRAAFNFSADAECSVEVDPRGVPRTRMAHLASLGFNRVSFGVQDFDVGVQQAVHREQPQERVFDLVAAAREQGMQSINVDMIYGLPRQTLESFERTLATLEALRPDRIALYGYAHLPERFKPQRRIDSLELPTGATRLALMHRAHEALTDAGYEYIGMDHFALPDDELSISKRRGCLHRNFQGYTTQPDCDLIALGISAIGRVGPSYVQNVKTLNEYYDLLRQGRLPVSRGLAMTRDDVLRRCVIMALMTQGRVDFESVEEAFLINFASYFEREINALHEMSEHGVVSVSSRAIDVTPLGWFVVRGIAMQFDRYLQADLNRQRFSRVI
jgi:oxygen-independent coproporphyrinogen-3 oxidase